MLLLALACVHPPPFAAACDTYECTLTWSGGPVTLGPVWSYAPSHQLLTPLPARNTWRVNASGGDGCPTLVQLACVRDDGPLLTEPFGNCEEPDGVRVEAGLLTFSFPPGEGVTASREAAEVAVDLGTCAFVAG